MAIQALGFASGILVIRVLPVHEYALYTLANTMLGTLTVLADGGIATGVMALGGKVWKDKDQLGTVLSTGMDLRKKFAIGSLLLATPVTIYLLRHHEASWMMTVLIVLSLIPAFFSALSGTLLQIPLKLKQDIIPLQKNQVGVNVARLGMLVLTIFVFPWAFIAILAAGLPQIWANIRLRKLSLPYANWNLPTEKEVRNEMLGYVKRILPGAIYFSVSGQLTIWLISIFGSTESIAQIGALSRLATILTVFSVIFGSLIEPRFARLPTIKRIILIRFIQLLFLIVVICTILVAFVYFFPEQVLSVLGSKYAGLTNELILIVIGSCLSLLSGLVFNLSSSRGIIPRPLIFFSVILGTQAFFIYFLDLSQLINVLWFSIMVASIGTIFRILYFIIKVNILPIHKI